MNTLFRHMFVLILNKDDSLFSEKNIGFLSGAPSSTKVSRKNRQALL